MFKKNTARLYLHALATSPILHVLGHADEVQHSYPLKWPLWRSNERRHLEENGGRESWSSKACVSGKVRKVASFGSRLFSQSALARGGAHRAVGSHSQSPRGKLPSSPPPSSGHQPNLATGLLEHCIKRDLNFLRFPASSGGSRGLSRARVSPAAHSISGPPPRHPPQPQLTWCSQTRMRRTGLHLYYVEPVIPWTAFVGEVKTRCTATDIKDGSRKPRIPFPERSLRQAPERVLSARWRVGRSWRSSGPGRTAGPPAPWWPSCSDYPDWQ